MGDLLPWLIGAWILVGQRKPAPASSRPSTSPPRTVPDVAYLYRLPQDGYETTRVAVAKQPADDVDDVRPRERGVFSNEANAMKLVRDNGWSLAWAGVRELEDRP